MRRSLTEEEQHKIAGAIVDHLESHNWKIEHGRPREGRGGSRPMTKTRSMVDRDQRRKTAGTVEAPGMTMKIDHV
jgi:hypothetical protein